MPIATNSSTGVVKIGEGLTIDSYGRLSVSNYSAYTLPTASNTVLGGVRIGSGIDITNGTISVNYTPQTATTSRLGVVQIGDGIDHPPKHNDT